MILDKIKLYIRTRTFNYPLCFTFLDSHKITVRTTAPITSDFIIDPEEYHLIRQKERKLLINNIIKNNLSDNIYFCSIGCGLAGEEYLIKDDVKYLTLIEPDYSAVDFLRDKFGKQANIVQSFYQFYHPEHLYDVIYTSGLGSWMMANPFLGVEEDLLKFCKSYLKEDGLFIALIYGGLHHPGYFLDKRYYIDNLIGSLKKYDLYPLLYGLYGKNKAILVAGKKESIRVDNIKSFAKHIYVENGNIRYNKDNLVINLFNFMIGCSWNILFMFKKFMIIIKETIQLIKINSKLIK